MKTGFLSRQFSPPIIWFLNPVRDVGADEKLWRTVKTMELVYRIFARNLS